MSLMKLDSPKCLTCDQSAHTPLHSDYYPLLYQVIFVISHKHAPKNYQLQNNHIAFSLQTALHTKTNPRCSHSAT